MSTPPTRLPKLRTRRTFWGMVLHHLKLAPPTRAPSGLEYRVGSAQFRVPVANLTPEQAQVVWNCWQGAEETRRLRER